MYFDVTDLEASMALIGAKREYNRISQNLLGYVVAALIGYDFTWITLKSSQDYKRIMQIDIPIFPSSSVLTENTPIETFLSIWPITIRGFCYAVFSFWSHNKFHKTEGFYTVFSLKLCSLIPGEMGFPHSWVRFIIVLTLCLLSFSGDKPNVHSHVVLESVVGRGQ